MPMNRFGLAGLGKAVNGTTAYRRYSRVTADVADTRRILYVSGGVVALFVSDSVSDVLIRCQGVLYYNYKRPTLRLESPAVDAKRPVVPSDDSKPALSTSDYITGDYISTKEVARHNLAQDAWVIVEGKVYESVLVALIDK